MSDGELPTHLRQEHDAGSVERFTSETSQYPIETLRIYHGLMHQWSKDHGKVTHEHGEKATPAQR